jgi:hypothetical protein
MNQDTIDLYFTVPVVVTVNVDTGEVDRVRVYDESVSAEPYSAYDTEIGGDIALDAPIVLAAVEAANETDWPVWEVG